MQVLDRINQPVVAGSFIIYATKTEAPSLNFAWVESITQGKYDLAIKITHANPDGSIKNKVVWDYDYTTGKGEHRDTGKPSTATLRSDSRYNDNRFLVTQPI